MISAHDDQPEDDRPHGRHLDSDPDAGGCAGLGVQREGGHLQLGGVRVSSGHGDLHLQPGLELPGNPRHCYYRHPLELDKT